MKYYITLCYLILSLASSTGKAGISDSEHQDGAKEQVELEESSPVRRAFLEGNNVFIGTEKDRESLPLPGPALAIHQELDSLFVALGASGVQVYKVGEKETTLQRHMSLPQGDAVGFFTLGNRLWVELHATSAVVLGGSSVSNVAIARASEQGEAKTVESEKPIKKNHKDKTLVKTKKLREEPVHVVGVFHGTAKLDIGTKDGVELDDRFEIFRKIEIKGGDESFVGEELVAMVEVVAANPESCIAKLPRGDRVLKGDSAIYGEKSIRSRNVLPKKLDNIGEFNFSVHPLLNLNGSGGAGGLLDANLSWYGKHYYAAIRIKPMAFGWTSNDGAFNSMFLAETGYDGRAFAVGLGLGMGATSGPMPGALGNFGGNSMKSTRRGAVAMSQHVRLGPKDGFNLMVYNSFLYETKSLSNGIDEGFRYGSTTGRINIPIGYRVSLFTEGGGGQLGFGYGEVGVFVWAKGNGDAGSIGVSGAIGLAGVSTYKHDGETDGDWELTSLFGPMVAFGFVHRFGFEEKVK